MGEGIQPWAEEGRHQGWGNRRDTNSQDRRSWKNEVGGGQVAADADATGETPGQVSLRGKWNLEEQAAPQEITLKARRNLQVQKEDMQCDGNSAESHIP